MSRLGFIGLGSMGLPMATRLLQHVQQNKVGSLTVFNRSVDKTASLAAAGAIVAPTVAAVAASCDIVFTMLSNDAAVREVYAELLQAKLAQTPVDSSSSSSSSSPSKLIYIDCSTIHPDTSREIRELVQSEPHRQFAAAPAWGRPDAAANGLLYFCLAAPVETRAVVKPFLLGMGRGVMELGDDSSKAHGMKLIGNFFIVSAIETLSEAFTLAEKADIPKDAVMDFINNLLPVPAYKGYGSMIANESYKVASPGFTLDLAIKDVSHMQSFAAQSGASLPIVDLALQNLKDAKDAGYGDRDWTAIVVPIRRKAGLQD